MTLKSFFDKEKDLNLLEKIAPLIIYPHYWIRNEAIHFIEVHKIKLLLLFKCYYTYNDKVL